MSISDMLPMLDRKEGAERTSRSVLDCDLAPRESVVTEDFNTKGHDTPHRITRPILLLLIHGGPYGQLPLSSTARGPLCDRLIHTPLARSGGRSRTRT